MTALFYISSTLIVLSAMASILLIGEPRKPTSPVQALVTLAMNGMILFTLIYFYKEAM